MGVCVTGEAGALFDCHSAATHSVLASGWRLGSPAASLAPLISGADFQFAPDPQFHADATAPSSSRFAAVYLLRMAGISFDPAAIETVKHGDADRLLEEVAEMIKSVHPHAVGEFHARTHNFTKVQALFSA